ncbi:MAG: hypothetical protein JWQ95_35 [Sphaerisporangium sp.]|nr:hypothetical protein [Sphaerisporangium sp.]
MHSGSGDLNNATHYHYTMLAGVAARSPRAYAVDDLARLGRHFVHPPGFGQARKVLATHRTVLLDGAPGSGRIAAAKVLLYELSSGTERFHELLWEEDERKPRLDPGHIGDDDRVWLDLSRVEERVWHDVQNELSSVRKAVIEHAAYLVVVLPGDQNLRADFSQYRAEIARPPGAEVLRRYLRLADVPGAVASPMTPLLAGYLDANRPIGEIAEFAGLVAKARASAAGKGDFPAWYKTAHEALTDRGRQVAERVAKLREQGPQRALLLATAMLHGAHADHVHRAAAALLSTVRYPDDECPSLERADLVERFGGIEAELGADGHVLFTELEYDSAVRAHFWNHMPELRDDIQAWVEGAVDSADLRQEDRDDLVVRFAEQCLHARYRQALVSSVFRWAKGPTTNRRLLAADRALRHGLTAEEHGQFFRKQIYNWSRDRDLPDGLAQVIIVMCSEVIAVHHPDEAMVRLHHRARRERRTTSAREALVRLVDGDLRLRRQMLARLTRVPAGGREWEVDADLFLYFADPVALTEPGSRNHALVAESDVRNMLADGWRRAFTQLTDVAWRVRLRQWLFLAFGDERHREVLVDTLVEGSGERGKILGDVYTTARDLPRPTTDEQERHAVFLDLVLRKICAAQGVEIV